MSTQTICIDQLAAVVPSTAVVVDVMRAFTTAAVALARSADGVVLAGSPAEALRAKEQIPDALALKDGAPDPSFDGVNSPVMIERFDLAGRPVVLTTTCGTVGAVAAETADLLICASFVVASATARYLRRLQSDVTFVVTGDKGRAQEDRACASYISDLIAGDGVDPAPYLRQAAESAAAADLRQGVERGYLGVHQDDVARCLQADMFDFAMVATREDHGLVLRAVS
ncbi:MAG TPA: 2-phosphosulfolactate phosphatase [Micromonosporaceae bacterium]|nr:2-phosphosulfolactate phosphatase [Micromonosporaceae bacterium]